MKFAAACCCLLLAACTAAPAGTGMDREPVKGVGEPIAKGATSTQGLWEQLRSGTPAAPEMEAKDAEYLNAPGAPLRTLSCLLPRDIATDRAWKLTDETVLPPGTRALWHANGLRLGWLPETRWEEFRRALNASEKNARTNVGVLSQEFSPITLRPFPEPLRKGGRMPGRAVLPLDTTLPPFAPTVAPIMAFEGDRVQLLATGIFSGKSFSGYRLVPHLHHPQSLLGDSLQTLDEEGKPRALKPWEKEVQGRMIDALATPELRPPKGHVLVVGLWWPWRKSDAEISAENAQALAKLKAEGKETPKDGQPADPEDLHLRNTPPPLPVTLGRALFTATQGEGEFQMILVVGAK